MPLLRAQEQTNVKIMGAEQPNVRSDTVSQADLDPTNLKTSIVIGDALVLAAFTATAYIAAYAYERGYCSHFGLPEHFVRVSIEVLIKCFVSIFLFFGAVIWVIDFVLGLLSNLNWDKLTNFALGIHVALLGLAMPFFVAYGFSWSGVRTFLVIVLVVDALILVTGLVTAGVVYLRNRWFPKRPSIKKEKLTVFGFLFRYVDPRYALLPMIVLPVVYGFAWLSGIREARNEVFFSAIPSKNLIMIRNYGDLDLCKPISLTSPSLAAGTVVLKDGDLSNVLIVSKDFTKPPSVEPTAKPEHV